MKVLIADDEMHIRNGLRTGIDWESLGIDMVLTAEDGREAHLVCQKERPEIIITDIRMPGMDGLELTGQAGRSLGAKKVIILSGYSEFEYAKKAIGLGVVDYLLKPVNIRELSELVGKCAADIREEERREGITRQEKIRDILDKKLPAEEIRNILYRKGGEILCPPEIAVGAVSLDKSYGRYIHGYEEVRGDVPGSRTVYLAEADEVLVYMAEIRTREERSGYYAEFAGLLNAVNRKLAGMGSCSMGVSGRGAVTDIPQLFEQAKKALAHRMYLGDGSCIYFDMARLKQEKMYPFLQFDRRRARESVEMLRIDQLRELISVHFDEMKRMKCTDVKAAQELCVTIKNVVFDVMREKGVDIAGILDSNQELFQSQMEYTSLDGYEAWICDYCDLLLRGLKDLSGKCYSAVISKAVDYMNQHYGEDITLKSLAEKVNKSASYFSCIFKKEMGVNFNEYLNQVRIKNAMEMLHMPDVVIYEVAEKTGFHDYKYFTKVFRKLCGCSPTEYINHKK